MSTVEKPVHTRLTDNFQRAPGVPHLPATPFRFILYFVAQYRWRYTGMVLFETLKATCGIKIPYALSTIIKAVTATQGLVAQTGSIIHNLRGPLLLFVAFGANAGTIEMKVYGLVCGFCAQGIEKTLRKNPATADVVVSLENKLVAVGTKEGADITDEVLTQALKNAGYEVKGITRTQRSIREIRDSLQAK